jgi:predicted metal-dependent hydrolase
MADDIKVIRRPVKHVRLRMMADGTLRVTAPEGVKIDPYLSMHAGWIAQKRAQIDGITAGYRDWADMLIFRGEPCHLVPAERCRYDPAHREMEYASPRSLKNTMKQWLREDLESRINDAGHRMGVSWNRFGIRMQRSRWGSCSSKHNLSFNLRLIALPDDLIEYVVAHELAHLVQPNHSPAFWSLVEEQYPRYRVAENELKRFWMLLEQNTVWRVIGQA